jgi:hypothetical protein
MWLGGRNPYRKLAGKPLVKHTLSRQRKRMNDNSKMDLREIQKVDGTDS